MQTHAHLVQFLKLKLFTKEKKMAIERGEHGESTALESQEKERISIAFFPFASQILDQS